MLTEVYFTRGRRIKRPKYVQQGAFAGARLANDGQHLLLFHLKVDCLKKNQLVRTLCADSRTSTIWGAARGPARLEAAARPQAACGGFVCGCAQFHSSASEVGNQSDLSSCITNAPLYGRGFVIGLLQNTLVPLFTSPSEVVTSDHDIHRSLMRRCRLRFRPAFTRSAAPRRAAPWRQSGRDKASPAATLPGRQPPRSAVGPARSEGQIVDGVDLGGEMDEAVVAAAQERR